MNEEQKFDGKVLSFTFDKVDKFTETETKARHTDEARRRRRIKGFANRATIDRTGELVEPDAFKDGMAKFMTNPLVFVNHDWAVPVGLVKAFEITKEGLIVDIEVESGFEEADKAWTLIEKDLLRSFSIGYRVLEDEFDKDLDALRIKSLELFEVSIVTIPMNAESTFTIQDGAVKSITMKHNGADVTYKQLISETITEPEESEASEIDTIMSTVSSPLSSWLGTASSNFKHIVDISEGEETFTITLKKEESDEAREAFLTPDNQVRKKEFSFQEGDCAFCEREQIKGLSWAVAPTGKEFLMCSTCFVAQDDQWNEEYHGKHVGLLNEAKTQIDDLEQKSLEYKNVIQSQQEEIDVCRTRLSAFKSYLIKDIAETLEKVKN